MARLRHQHSPIAEHADFAWTFSLPSIADRAPLRVPADGRVEVIWSERGLVAGGHVTRPITIGPEHPRLVVGVQLKLGRAAALLGVKGEELVGEARMLSDLWGREGDLLAERIDAAPTPQTKADVLMDGLDAHARAGVSADPVVDHVAAQASRPDSRFSAIARDVGYSERQLRRRFADAVGFGPKLLQRIERFQRFLSLATNGDHRGDVARAAAELGYSDESHLARDARELGGASPGTLISQQA